jgi:plastocyanin
MSRPRKVLTIVMLGTMGSIIGLKTASAGGGCHSGTTEGRGTTIEMVDACFTPTTLFVEPGDTVTFTNRDDFAHNVTANGWGYYDQLGTGDRFTMSFSDDGIYPYACTIHDGMTGAIVVGEGDDGTGVVAVDPKPLASQPASPHDDRWITAGVIGLVLGGAAGAGIASLRRRDPERSLQSRAT